MKREELEGILTACGIPFSYQTRKAVNVDCPYCGDVEKYHCGIFLDKLNFSCFHCGERGSLFYLLTEGFLISTSLVKEHFKTRGGTRKEEDALSEVEKILAKETELIIKPRVVVWPPEGSVPIAKMKKDYVVNDFLTRRKFSLKFCIEKDIYIGIAGPQCNRFIIPVKHNNKVVALQGRSMVDGLKPKFKSDGDMKQFLYNYDGITRKSRLIIVEGVFDSWAIENSVATFGTSISEVQLAKIASLRPTELILAWDMGEDGSDAYWKGFEALRTLTSSFPDIPMGYVTFPVGEDPDSLGKESMVEVLKTRIIYSNEVTASDAPKIK